MVVFWRPNPRLQSYVADWDGTCEHLEEELEQKDVTFPAPEADVGNIFFLG